MTAFGNDFGGMCQGDKNTGTIGTDAILNIHSNASYLSETKAHSHACGHFFMGSKPDATKPIKRFSHYVPSCASSSLQLLKQNSEPSS
jgi:hypothetical protein